MKHLIQKFSKPYNKLPFAAQIILTIMLVFVSFFILQLFLNSVFFGNHFLEREIDSFETRLSDFNTKLSTLESDEYFDEMYKFTSNNNAFTIVLDEELRMTESTFSLVIYDLHSEQFYNLLITDINRIFVLGEDILATIYPGPGDFYIVESFTDMPSLDDAFIVEGYISEIKKPDNLNFLYRYYPLVISNTANIINNSDLINSLEDDPYYREVSLDQTINTAVFITPLTDDTYLLTLFIIQDIASILSTVSSYQNYVYLTAIVIIILWSFRIGPMISTPIKNIENTAKQIANLNFNINADEYRNRETSSLSNSINLIAKNLASTIETINNKNNELIMLYEEQQEQTKLKKQLVSAISHELKTPLMIMQATVQGILDDIIPEEEKSTELLNVIEEINKSSIMIQDLLQIYRLDEKENLDNDTINLSELTHFHINSFHNLFKKYRLNLNVKIKDNLFIQGDTTLIKRVISNFMLNAIKYTPENESIYITVSERPDKVYFEILNTGATIDEKHLNKIWMPFYRIENNPNDRVRGSGIGLYLVSEVLDAHQFDYGLENTKNGIRAYFIAPKCLDID